MDILKDLVLQLGTLGGVGLLIPAVINILKSLNVVKDGTAPTWSAGLNLLALLGLFLVHVIDPAGAVDKIGIADTLAGQIAQIAVLVFGLYLQIKVSGWGHQTLRGIKLVGKSYSAK